MKFFNNLLFAGAAFGSIYTNLDFLSEADRADPAIKSLLAILDKNNYRLDTAIGEQTRELNWRKQMNRNLNHISSRMIDDYKERREKYDCNPERMTRARTQIEQTLDWYDASVQEKCDAIAKPMKRLSKAMKKWLDQWNKCGSGPPRIGFHNRMQHRLRKVRSRVYYRIGCKDVKPMNEGKPKQKLQRSDVTQEVKNSDVQILEVADPNGNLNYGHVANVEAGDEGHYEKFLTKILSGQEIIYMPSYD